MELGDLLLGKEEIPIVRETSFSVPICPLLLNPNTQLDPNLAHELFPKVAVEWYDELKEYTATVEDPKIKRWYEEVFLKRKPLIQEDGTLDRAPIGWKNGVQTEENGFAYVLSISRDAGGSLYFNPEDRQCVDYISSGFSQEKLSAYTPDDVIQSDKFTGKRLFVYAHHNIDYYPGALFLRNWAIAYLNEAMKSLFE